MKAMALILNFLILTTFTYASEDCRENSHYKVLSQYMYYDYVYVDGKHELVSKEKRTTVMFEGWSEVAGELFEVFFETKYGAPQPDRVIVQYNFGDQKMYTKNFTLEDAELSETEGKVQKLSNYTFNDGVMKKELRPGIQTYSFFKGDKPLCELKVRHIFVEEDD